MPDILIYNNATYHITDGRKSIFEGEWEVRKGGIYVEYPSKDILPLANRDKIKIKKTILDFYKESKGALSYASYQRPIVNLGGSRKSAKSVHLKFRNLDISPAVESKNCGAENYII